MQRRTKNKTSFQKLSKILNSEFSNQGIESKLTDDNRLLIRLDDKIVEIDDDYNIVCFNEIYQDLTEEDRDMLFDDLLDKIDNLRTFFTVFSPENDEKEFYQKFLSMFEELQTDVNILKDIGVISELDFTDDKSEFIAQPLRSKDNKTRTDN